ncbi:hypothetical protein GOHSU_12_00330 [Gordonia hirsuta DSM 44140 = NBRC 16056]|uniref:DUF222 domain-containing protein n=1 Tax=Gordonia hirsuta DSM 44140 = NBRC 16056 TaxID=1121927 RepID=L7L9D7_9ACTN|nr:DUF222 domain-containing protein [Gordonia hirsuta]GAC56643.1 hypothetical protein GOHSU_12_00330 [Gordonia hirsuta DSM 44140 = NBRC 16056]
MGQHDQLPPSSPSSPQPAEPRRWRDADLSPLQLGAKVTLDDDPSPRELRAAQLDRIHRVLSTCKGESYLMWLRLDAVADLIEQHQCGTEPADPAADPASAANSAEFTRLLEPRTQLAAALATAMSISRFRAEALLDQGEALRHRLPECGLLLRDGVIEPRTFARLVFETEGVTDPALLAEIDHRIAEAIRASGQVAPHAAGQQARTIVTLIDAEGARTDREIAKDHIGVTVYSRRGGMATLEITDSAETIVAEENAIDALVKGVCPNDPRSTRRRRADAAAAHFGAKAFTCQCDREDCTAWISSPGSGRSAQLVVHVITDGSTLEGGDKPGHLGGYGTIDASQVRDIADRPGTRVRPLNLTDLTGRAAQQANPYRPSATLDAVIRGLFPTCTWPGCERPAHRCQLDHVTEFNHDHPEAGGATCYCNINPKCLFHHQLKTFGDDWLDDQIVDAHGTVWTEVTTPHGVTVRTRALNTWLFPGLGLIPCGHGPPIAPGPGDPGAEPTRTLTRTEAKHAYRQRLRARNRMEDPPY